MQTRHRTPNSVGNDGPDWSGRRAVATQRGICFNPEGAASPLCPRGLPAHYRQIRELFAVFRREFQQGRQLRSGHGQPCPGRTEKSHRKVRHLGKLSWGRTRPSGRVCICARRPTPARTRVFGGRGARHSSVHLQSKQKASARGLAGKT